MPSTDTLPRPPVAEDEPPGLHLSVTQVVASALAAVTATLAASYLGVAGTLIGAAVASVVTVVGNALYAHSIARTRDRVQGTLHLASRPSAPPSAAVSAPTTAAARKPSPLRRIGGWRLAAAAGVVFVVLLAIMGTVGLVAGRSVTSIVRNEPVHSAPTVSPHSTTPASSAAPSTATSGTTTSVPTTAAASTTSSSPSTDATSPAATQSAAPSGSAVQTPSAPSS